VSGFSADWLALREPFDAAARSAALVADLCAHLASGTATTPLEVVDLGAGAGSNLRHLAPLLGGEQSWRLVDHDRALLDAAIAATRVWAEARGADVRGQRSALTVRAADFACEVHCEQRDLRDIGGVDLPARALVTAAALLDLVSAKWLEALARRTTAALARVCFVLTYDGRSVCTPSDPEDTAVRALFNRHQRGDKGFGPALGPDAASAAVSAFARRSYHLSVRASDWRIGPRDAAMQHALLDGWLGAALEMAPDRTRDLTAWHTRRRALVTAGDSALSIGHVDFVGWL
jgi:hypothetical protein